MVWDWLALWWGWLWDGCCEANAFAQRESIMQLPKEAQLLRIFVGENDKHAGRPLYEAIVDEARRQGMAGATVLRGTLGFGAHSRIHTAKILRLSEELPMVVEIVDKPEQIAQFLPTLDGMITEGLVTLEKVQVLVYRAGTQP
jgi:PII-like signaling protein